ncbi:DUF6226 family protein [Ruania halotolerans]|uniref:DUF6226 family protein n=1 Tax=Ruania halotolerans TaxID=2897773 RepID=UPI001E32ED9C|nr:DUF6226 family protein [Ruania halotolerans]UFU05994.1 DUF6226 family protein [Ruania halotolerans]
MGEREVRRAVEAIYAALPESRITWPNPRPDGAEPPDEAYSRVTDPERYVIVGARVLAWQQALLRLDLATAESIPITDPPRWSATETGVRLVPHAEGALSLVLTTRRLEDVPECVLGLGIGDPPAWLDPVPDCACDACDFGSATLLEAIDESILDVVRGEFVHAVGPGWHVTAVADGQRAGWSADCARPNVEQVIADARAGHPVASASRVLVSASWLQ